MHKFIILLLVFISLPTYAFHAVPLKDNETAKLTLSSKSLNRIFVTGDRIVETYGMEGAFKIEKDEQEGSIYLIPASHAKTQSFNLFIKTENGHNYSLYLTPAEIESKTIGIKPLSPAKIQAKRWEMNSPYAHVLLNLINDMAKGKSPEGYESIPLEKENHQREQLRYPLASELMSIYRGEHLEGQVWRVINKGNKTIYLNPKNFHDESFLAASFDKKIIKQNETTTLYWVKNYAS
jgi:type-F conjugative transfer system secretin TraK